MKSLKQIVSKSLCSLPLLVLIIPLFIKKWLTWSFTYLSWYILLFLILSILFKGVSLIKEVQLNQKIFFPIMLLSLTVSLIVVMPLKKEFKILSDETNILAVSKNLYENKEALNITMVKKFYDQQIPVKKVMPKRPLAFPFILSLLHTLKGFSYQNVFILNFLILFSLIFIISLFTYSVAGALSSLTAVLLVLSQPLILINSTSAGFDLFNAFMILLLLAILIKIKNSEQPVILTEFFLLFSALLFNARYESPLIVFFMYIILISKNKIKTFIKCYYKTIAILPLFFAPQLWQRIIKWGDFQLIKGKELFSLTNLFSNSKEFTLTTFSFSNNFPVSHTLIILGFLSLIIGIFCFSKFLPKQKRAFSISLTIFALCFLLVLSHFFGRIAHPSSSRFFIFPLIILSLSPLFLVHGIFPFLKKQLLFLSLISMIINMPVASRDELTNSLTQTRKFRFTREALKYFHNRNVLIIDNRPGQYTALGYAAVSLKYARKNRLKLIKELNSHLYEGIVLIEEIFFDKQRNKQDLFALNKKIVAELRTRKDRFIRVSYISIK